MNLSDMRRNYAEQSLDIGDLDPSPFVQFDRWMRQAIESQLLEPNAMSLATVGAGSPEQGTPLSAAQGPSAPKTIDVVVHEGTSMSIAVSPDARTLAIDLHGGIWTLPASGGTAKRVTDEYNDAREPVR